jgi:hypothetical protein
VVTTPPRRNTPLHELAPSVPDARLFDQPSAERVTTGQLRRVSTSCAARLPTTKGSHRDSQSRGRLRIRLRHRRAVRSIAAASAAAAGAGLVASTPPMPAAAPTSTAVVTSKGRHDLAIITSTGTQQAFDSRVASGPPRRESAATATLSPTAVDDYWQPAFPVRAAFYYPWFGEAWTQNGVYPFTNYNPSRGYYDSRSSNIIAAHLDDMQYGGLQAGIASWWGQGSKEDARIPLLLDAARSRHFRWSLYYEAEGYGDPTVSRISTDLAYIKSRFGLDKEYLEAEGRPVVFVYADPADGCGMARRWKEANTLGFHVVLKVFQGYTTCAAQPDSWHQYSPAVGADSQGTFSFSISPGFWLEGDDVRLARDLDRFESDVVAMRESGARWQLVTTFNEWGEGTSVLMTPTPCWPPSRRSPARPAWGRPAGDVRSPAPRICPRLVTI